MAVTSCLVVGMISSSKLPRTDVHLPIAERRYELPARAGAVPDARSRLLVASVRDDAIPELAC